MAPEKKYGDAECVSHCEDCCLGYIDYDCPACGKGGQEFGDPWWDRDKLWADPPQTLEIVCERCGAVLELSDGPEGLRVAAK